ncbi:MAG: hypothetical protein HC908_14475, partial [Calothrix sp. SM1_7_51]|nr:hypothetical protein [Calothrix sp. SM1_7_51]
MMLNFMNFMNLEIIPVLPKRESNIEKFATYLMLNTQNGRSLLQWKYQPALRRNMELYAGINHNFSDLCRQQDKGIALAEFWRHVALNDKVETQLECEPASKRKLAWEHLAS